MPNYNFKNNITEEEYTIRLSMNEREDYIKNNNVTQLPSPLFLHSGRGLQRPDEGFRDILREMKKKHSKGITRSTINTF